MVTLRHVDGPWDLSMAQTVQMKELERQAIAWRELGHGLSIPFATTLVISVPLKQTQSRR